MKNTLKSVLALAMVFCMLFTIVGCGDSNREASSQQAAGEDFFGDEVTQDQKEDTSSDAVVSNGNGSTTNKDSYIPDENKIGGKSWKEVLASMPKKLSGTKLVMYNFNPAAEYTGAPAVIDSFTKQTGIKVEWKTINYNQYWTKLPALIASGENIPDLARLYSGEVKFLKCFQPLSAAKYDFTDEAWDKKMMKAYTYNGKAFATSLQNTHIGSINVMFYNKSLMKKHFKSSEDPYKLWKSGKWTWSKYIEMCKKYKEETGMPGSCGEGMFRAYLTCWGINGAVKFDGKKFVSNMSDKKFLEIHQLLGDLYNKDALFAHGGVESFDKGNMLFSIGTAVHARKKNSYFGNLKATNNLYMVPMPEIDGQKKYYQGQGEAEAYGIVKGASNPEAVPYFLRYFLDGSNYELSSYFGNTQNLEVYNWCMNRENKIYIYGYPVDMNKINNNGIQTQTGAAMKSYIDSNKGKVDKMVNEFNEVVSKLK